MKKKVIRNIFLLKDQKKKYLKPISRIFKNCPKCELITSYINEKKKKKTDNHKN